MSFIDTIINWFKKLFGIGGSDASSVPTPKPAYVGPIGGPWDINYSNGVTNDHTGSFDFPVGNPMQVSVNYVECGGSGIDISHAGSITLDYEITGDTPVFDFRTNADNNPPEGGVSTVRLLLHQSGDNLSGVGPYSTYRWYSVPATLAVGTNTLTVPLTMDQWSPVFKGTNDVPGWNSCLANIGSLGFVFGGGYFAGHGVALTSGTARFNLKSYTVNA